MSWWPTSLSTAVQWAITQQIVLLEENNALQEGVMWHDPQLNVFVSYNRTVWSVLFNIYRTITVFNVLMNEMTCIWMV